MAERVVVHSLTEDSEPTPGVAARLRAAGVGIVEQQENMLLVDADADTAKRAIGDAKGWGVTAETTVAPPRMRERVLRPPGK
jgi:hypothetical protein